MKPLHGPSSFDECGANVSLDEEESDIVAFELGNNIKSENLDILAGVLERRFLNDRLIKFDIMQNVKAAVWQPLEGVRDRD